MRRWILLVLAGAVLLSVVALTRGAGRGAAPTPKAPFEVARPRDTDPTASGRPAAEAPPLSRDPFEYVDERSSPLPGPEEDSRRIRDRPAISLPSPSPDPVHLVGLLRRDGALMAALSIGGQVEVVAVGDEVAGYRVLSIDEDAGARLRGPDGLDRTVAPAP
jgi:hypothetical protein